MFLAWQWEDSGPWPNPIAQHHASTFLQYIISRRNILLMTSTPVTALRNYYTVVARHISRNSAFPRGKPKICFCTSSRRSNMSEQGESHDASNPNLKPSIFTLYNTDNSNVVSESDGARLGCVSLPGRKSLETPNFLALTSRGVVPHISPDVVGEQTDFCGVYTAIEDCRVPHHGRRISYIQSTIT